MRLQIITIFPDLINGALKYGVVGQAINRGEVAVKTINPRQFTTDIHQTVDDRPFGGGDGMVMLAKPLAAAMDSLGDEAGHRVYLSPQGKIWNDSKARAWGHNYQNLTLVCGRYGGADQRFLNQYIDEEISIGDYILSGGEMAALVLIDSLVRQLPNTLGNEQSLQAESFADGLLEAALFTRPRDILSQTVPQLFLSGDHQLIAQFRRALGLFITLEKRPELLTELHKIELPKAKKLLQTLSVEELLSSGLGKNSLKVIYGEN